MNYLPFSLNTFNKPVISTFSSHLDAAQNKKIALVVQGGGQRGIFTSGVLDSFLDHEFDPFALYIGTSAGALNLSSYISRQPRFGHRFITRYTTSDRFFNLSNYLSKRSPMNLDWALQVVSPSGELPLDFCQAKRTLLHRKAFACATRKDTLQDTYLPLYQHDWREVLLASCAIPVLYNQPVYHNELEWVDGGVSAAVPVQEAWRQGADLVVVIRTEPVGGEAQDAPRVLEDWRESIEGYLPHYLADIALNQSVEKIRILHQEISDRFEQWREDYLHTTQPRPDDEKSTSAYDLSGNAQKGQTDFPQGSWLSYIGLDRVLKVTSQTHNKDIIDILVHYFSTYQAANDFLSMPPDGLHVIQIAPNKSLHSRALLSSRDDLERDYHQGRMIGRQFMVSFSQLLNEKSSLMHYMRGVR